jgi:hypothetical protein
MNPIIQKLEQYSRSAVSFLYRWVTTDGEILGYILSVVHFLLVCALAVAFVISHTVYPSFWFQCLLYSILLLIWLQHVFLKACFLMVAEKNFTQTVSPFYTLSKDILGIPTDDIITYFLIAETVAVICFGLEISRSSSLWLYSSFNISML